LDDKILPLQVELIDFCNELHKWTPQTSDLSEKDQVTERVCIVEMSTRASDWLLIIKKVVAEQRGQPMSEAITEINLQQIPLSERYRLDKLSNLAINFIQQISKQQEMYD